MSDEKKTTTKARAASAKTEAPEPTVQTSSRPARRGETIIVDGVEHQVRLGRGSGTVETTDGEWFTLRQYEVKL